MLGGVIKGDERGMRGGGEEREMKGNDEVKIDNVGEEIRRDAEHGGCRLRVMPVVNTQQ